MSITRSMMQKVEHGFIEDESVETLGQVLDFLMDEHGPDDGFDELQIKIVIGRAPVNSIIEIQVTDPGDTWMITAEF
jgi:hypothetical protein